MSERASRQAVTSQPRMGVFGYQRARHSVASVCLRLFSRRYFLDPQHASLDPSVGACSTDRRVFVGMSVLESRRVGLLCTCSSSAFVARSTYFPPSPPPRARSPFPKCGRFTEWNSGGSARQFAGLHAPALGLLRVSAGDTPFFGPFRGSFVNLMRTPADWCVGRSIFGRCRYRGDDGVGGDDGGTVIQQSTRQDIRRNACRSVILVPGLMSFESVRTQVPWSRNCKNNDLRIFLRANHFCLFPGQRTLLREGGRKEERRSLGNHEDDGTDERNSHFRRE